MWDVGNTCICLYKHCAWSKFDKLIVACMLVIYDRNEWHAVTFNLEKQTGSVINKNQNSYKETLLSFILYKVLFIYPNYIYYLIIIKIAFIIY